MLKVTTIFAKVQRERMPCFVARRVFFEGPHKNPGFNGTCCLHFNRSKELKVIRVVPPIKNCFQRDFHSKFKTLKDEEEFQQMLVIFKKKTQIQIKPNF